MTNSKIIFASLCFLVWSVEKSYASPDHCRPSAQQTAERKFAKDFPGCKFDDAKLSDESSDLYQGKYVATFNFANSHLNSDDHCPTTAEYIVTYQTPPPVFECRLGSVTLTNKRMADHSELPFKNCFRVSTESQMIQFFSNGPKVRQFAIVGSDLEWPIDYSNPTKFSYNADSSQFESTDLKKGDMLMQKDFIGTVPNTTRFGVWTIPLTGNQVNPAKWVDIKFSRREHGFEHDYDYEVDFESSNTPKKWIFSEVVKSEQSVRLPKTCLNGICVEMFACSLLNAK